VKLGPIQCYFYFWILSIFEYHVAFFKPKFKTCGFETCILLLCMYITEIGLASLASPISVGTMNFSYRFRILTGKCSTFLSITDGSHFLVTISGALLAIQ
jgi:hypothetical protein